MREHQEPAPRETVPPVAVDWLARQLAWERRLTELRTPEPSGERDQAA
ncbi:MAG: hypothetical protein ACOYNI_12555 [Acidimicrobiia bacterium]